MAAKKTSAKPMSKTELINAVVEGSKVPKKEVKAVLDALTAVGHKELKRKNVFTVPGFAKLTVTKKPATKERKGVNPFTGEPMIIKAKPARKSVRARPVKAAKDAVL